MVHSYLEISFAVVPIADFIFIFKGKKSILIKYLSLWWLKVAPKLVRGMRNEELFIGPKGSLGLPWWLRG